MVNLQQIKWDYNNTLNRYYNGCNYLIDYPEQFDKYIDKLMELKDKLNMFLEQIMKEENVTSEEILGGFKLC